MLYNVLALLSPNFTFISNTNFTTNYLFQLLGLLTIPYNVKVNKPADNKKHSVSHNEAKHRFYCGLLKPFTVLTVHDV